MPLPHRRGLAATTGGIAALALAALALLALAGPASAHVTVNPNTATQGGYAKLTFRVPTEEANASTVKLQVFFPPSEPLASVSVKPHPGWSYRVATKRLSKPVTTGSGSVTRAVSKITWTADSPASAIKPGQFDEFDISTGPLPTASSMEFKALQTYSDGHVVRWIQSTAGGAEAEHPAPVLTLLPASATASSATTTRSGDHSTTALVLSIVALVVALAAAGASVLRRSRT